MDELTVRIDRRGWRRGTKEKAGILLSMDGERDAMGHVCQAGGLEDHHMVNKYTLCTALDHLRDADGWLPFQLPASLHPAIGRLLDCYPIQVKMHRANDLDGLDDAERERRLIEAGLKVGVRFEFVTPAA